MHKTSRIVAAVLALSVAAGAGAQEPDAGSPVGGPGCAVGAAQVVVGFLGLTPPQGGALGLLLEERQRSVAPVLQEIALREQRIRELLAVGGDPIEIGALVVQVHHLKGQVEAVQAVILARFEALLDDAQRERWGQVRGAAQLQPVVPAFAALQLL